MTESGLPQEPTKPQPAIVVHFSCTTLLQFAVAEAGRQVAKMRSSSSINLPARYVPALPMCEREESWTRGVSQKVTRERNTGHKLICLTRRSQRFEKRKKNGTRQMFLKF
jgi:hypothetical protein